MSAAHNLEQIFKVIEGGKSVSDTSNIIKFTADNGKVIGDCVKSTAKLGNGSTVSIFNKVATGASGLVTSGLSFLAMDVGVAGMCLAPVLGLVGGLALTEMQEPELFARAVQDLTDLGKTIGGKVIGYFDPESKNITFDPETIDVFKNAYFDAGYYDMNFKNPTVDASTKLFPNGTIQPISNLPAVAESAINSTVNFVINNISNPIYHSLAILAKEECLRRFYKMYNGADFSSLSAVLQCYNNGDEYRVIIELRCFLYDRVPLQLSNSTGYKDIDGNSLLSFPTPWSNWSTTYKHRGLIVAGEPVERPQGPVTLGSEYYSEEYSASDLFRDSQKNSLGFFGLGHRDPYVTSYGTREFVVCNVLGGFTETGSNLQENAVAPDRNITINNYYPNYLPLQHPQYVIGDFPTAYPVPLPSTVTPNITQGQAQNPNNDLALEPLLNLLLDILPAVEKVPSGEVVPLPDPEPQPEPLPLPDTPPVEVPDNPVDPNTPPELDIWDMLPTIPETVSSNNLFRVYNPTASQLDSLGAFLWSNNILDQLVKIWQNPLDGIISLIKVYAPPQVGGETEIVLGNIGSGVNAKIVTDQFANIYCGAVKIPELKNNATDYSPYTTVSIYLPFIGIMELDANEVMNSTLTLIYHVDVYTGTCLAEIYVMRDCDLQSAKVLYTFTGNCSQVIPLTSSDARGLISSLVSLGALAIGTASGGGASIAAGSIGGIMNHEMQHVSHSGALSSNAGIMGYKKPYIIISRQQSYDANNYNELYGYPSNATVYLANCSGYQKIKSIHLKSDANGDEKKEIVDLLLKGIIV